MVQKITLSPTTSKQIKQALRKPRKAKVEVSGQKRINFEIPASLHANFKAECAFKGQKMGDVITGFIREYLKNKQV